MITIEQAVAELKTAWPQMRIDGLYPDRWHPEPDSVERLTYEALRWPEQINECVDWLTECRLIKTHRRHIDTYTYKHEVESWIGHWVSHTSFLVAVQMQGLDMIENPDRLWAGLLPLGAKRPC